MLASQQFQPNAFQEHLIKLRARDRKTFESLSPSAKAALGIYEAGKREAEHLEQVRKEGATK